MTEDHAFLCAVLAAPRDPMPRLVYADWLEERGDSHGEDLRLLAMTDGLLPLAFRPEAIRQRLEELQECIDPLWAALMHRGRPQKQGTQGRGGNPPGQRRRRSRREAQEADIGLFLQQ